MSAPAHSDALMSSGKAQGGKAGEGARSRGRPLWKGRSRQVGRQQGERSRGRAGSQQAALAVAQVSTQSPADDRRTDSTIYHTEGLQILD